MIGKAYRLGTGFKGLAACLERGHLNELDPERVAWIDSRNLPTRDPEGAARLMAATARDSERCVKPVYHLSISFDPGDPVNPETMRRVADRTLRDLGLDDHQALLVAHRDRQHPHVHIVVNRVHPERRTAWSNSWDYRRIEQSLRAQEADLGLRVVPGKHAPVPERALGRVRETPQRVPGDLPFVERVRAQAGPHLTGARSWAELESGLAEHGLSLRLKGRGMVLTDGHQEVKASEIDREASRFRLERRLGLYTDYRARQAVAARTLEEREPLRALEERVRRLRDRVRGPGAERTAIPAGIKPERPRTPQVQRPPAPDVERNRPRIYREAAREFSREAGHLYADPAAARRAFLTAAERSGADRAAARLGDEPHRFGALRPGADPARARRAADAAFDYARHHATRDRPALTQAAALLREVDHHQRAEHGLDGRLSRSVARRAGARPAGRAAARSGPRRARAPRGRCREIPASRCLRGFPPLLPRLQSPVPESGCIGRESPGTPPALPARPPEPEARMKNEDLHGNAPDRHPAALIVLDMINDLEFPEGEAVLEQALPAAERIAALAERARAAGVPVIFANDNFGRWRSNLDEVVRHVLEDGVRGRPVVERLRPTPDDYVVLKPKHTAFFSTPLDTLLKHLGTEHLVITGMSTEMCVLFTAMDAHVRDLHLHVPADCVAAASPERTGQALRYLEEVLGADVRESGEVDFGKMGREDEG